MAKSPKSPSAEEIVEKWRARLESRLKPWHLQPTVVKSLKTRLENNIKSLTKGGEVFTAKDMTNSLKVAGDVARICKILQPSPHPKLIKLDTFQRVLSLCAKSHKVCRRPGGAGGWCDV